MWKRRYMLDLKPNFLVVGAGKAGTTSLYHYLRQIDGIFLPALKEPHYFVHPEVAERIHTVVQDESDYLGLYADSKQASWRGDMSVCYLYYAEQAIPRILSMLGSATKIGDHGAKPDRASLLGVSRCISSQSG